MPMDYELIPHQSAAHMGPSGLNGVWTKLANPGDPDELLSFTLRLESFLSRKRKPYTTLLQWRAFLKWKKWESQRKDLGGRCGFSGFYRISVSTTGPESFFESRKGIPIDFLSVVVAYAFFPVLYAGSVLNPQSPEELFCNGIHPENAVFTTLQGKKTLQCYLLRGHVYPPWTANYMRYPDL